MQPDWEPAFQDAVLEMDFRRLGMRIDTAVVLLCARLAELGRCPEHMMERHRIVDALQMLHTIRKTEPNLPYYEERQAQIIH